MKTDYMNKLKSSIHREITKVYCRLLPRRTSTSLSDNLAYPQICMDAVNSARHFNEFRENPIYSGIVETVDKNQGKQYLDICQTDTRIMGKMGEFEDNDKWGGPVRYVYDGVGNFSPTTLRYIKVLKDLTDHFTTLDKLDICEIGVGYGGQCRIINAMFTPRTYQLVDIKPALLLAQRYLDNYPLHSALSYKTMNELSHASYDLCISNYAFSELPRQVQDIYLEKVILTSKAGYITYSDNFTPSHFHSYRVDELLKIIPGSKKMKEEPLTGPNYIILWGNS